jgi:hypothetical protein
LCVPSSSVVVYLLQEGVGTSATVVSSVFIGSYAYLDGGAVYQVSQGDATFEDTLFEGTSAGVSTWIPCTHSLFERSSVGANMDTSQLQDPGGLGSLRCALTQVK